MPPLTRTFDSSRFQAARVAARIASKSKSGASASRLRRAPSSSTNEIPKLTVTSPPSSQPTQPPVVDRPARVERPAEARDEEDRVAAAAPARHLAVADHSEAAVGDALDAARRVEHELRAAGGRERVALHPRVLRRGQLHRGGRLREEDAVVAGLGPLGRVVVRRLDLVRIERGLAEDGHDRHVAALLHARAGEVHEAECLDRGVAPQVARVGELAARVGRVLDHPERRRRSREDEAGRERADHRVDVAREVLVGRARGRRGDERERAERERQTAAVPYRRQRKCGRLLALRARSRARGRPRRRIPRHPRGRRRSSACGLRLRFARTRSRAARRSRRAGAAPPRGWPARSSCRSSSAPSWGSRALPRRTVAPRRHLRTQRRESTRRRTPPGPRPVPRTAAARRPRDASARTRSRSGMGGGRRGRSSPPRPHARRRTRPVAAGRRRPS